MYINMFMKRNTVKEFGSNEIRIFVYSDIAQQIEDMSANKKQTRDFSSAVNIKIRVSINLSLNLIVF